MNLADPELHRTYREQGFIILRGMVPKDRLGTLTENILAKYAKVGSGLYSIALLVFPAALAPVAVGAIVLGVAGPPPVDGRSIRAGLTMLGVGLLGYLAANYVPAPDGMNSLQSWPHIIGLLGGLALAAAGLLVTGLALARSRWRNMRSAA